METFSITIGTDTFPVCIWDSSLLIGNSGDVVSLVIENINVDIKDFEYSLDYPFNESDWVIVASSLQYNVIIPSNELFNFFLKHKHVKWITYNSEKCFCILLKTLKQKNEKYTDILWEIVNNGNYRDIELLGKLYFLIENEKELKNLHDLIYRITNVNITPIIQKYNKKIKKSNNNKEKTITNNNNKWIFQKKKNIIHAISIRYTWNRLELLSSKIMDIYKNEMYNDAKASFGLLTDIIQVKSKISLFFTQLRGIHLDITKINHLKNQFIDNLYKIAEELLCFLPYSRFLFTIGIDGKIESNEVGIPDMNIKALKDALHIIYKELYNKDSSIDIKFNIEVEKTSKYPINISQWEFYRHQHPFLDKWIEFQKEKMNYEYILRISEYKSHSHPKWNYVQSNGRASCVQPNIQVTPKQSNIRSIFIPKKNHSFLIVDYKYIELCTFSAIAEYKYNYSMLANVIRDNTDPHSYTASIFYSYLLPEFLKLKETNPEEYTTKRNLAKFLNFAILSGIGIKKLKQQVQITCEHRMDEETLKEFKKKLLHHVYPEMALHQYSDRVSLWIRNLGCTRREFMNKCIFPKSTKYTRKHENKIVRVLRGRNYKGYIKWEKQFWKALVNINRNSALVEILQDSYSKNKGGAKVANALCSYTSCTLTGRIRRNINWSVHNNIGFSGLAADGAKLALWNLEYVGYKVVGFIHDEFIIEIDKNKDNIELALEIICESMKEVVKTIPIRCEYSISSEWTSPDKQFSL